MEVERKLSKMLADGGEYKMPMGEKKHFQKCLFFSQEKVFDAKIRWGLVTNNTTMVPFASGHYTKVSS